MLSRFLCGLRVLCGEERLSADRRFLATALLVCGAGALWLLLSPAAFERRARTRAADSLRTQVEQEWQRNIVLERYRSGLEGDPAVIEREARKLGYGRPGERTYPLSQEEIRAQEARLAESGQPHRLRLWFREVGRAVAPALMLILAGAVAVLFFTDLRVEEPDGPKSRVQNG